ncbi:MAG: hypothetical protein R3271_07155 [Methylophaga sp.]|uniref:hypothetical protein n=1 Tax=Methylophaga sp. TaxID=2024840 RepID=UPI00299EEC35|nr:hypothetical protein [Methylophaga sp.]MDX1750080.1 hypothetical protein [Methylophaga sp.]
MQLSPIEFKLLWKLSLTITVGTIALFWIIHYLILQTEQRVSFIDKQEQKQLIDYARHAEMLFLQGEDENWQIGSHISSSRKTLVLH